MLTWLLRTPHHPADGDENANDELQHQFLVETVLVHADLYGAPPHGVRKFGGDREIRFRDDHRVGDHLLAGAEVGLGPRKQAFIDWSLRLEFEEKTKTNFKTLRMACLKRVGVV